MQGLREFGDTLPPMRVMVAVAILRIYIVRSGVMGSLAVILLTRDG